MEPPETKMDERMSKIDENLGKGPSRMALREKRGTSQGSHGIGRYHKYPTRPEDDARNAKIERKRQEKLARRRARRKAGKKK